MLTALTDIQRSLNAIRTIEREGSAELRLAALALLTATSADIAKELRGAKPVAKSKAPVIKPPTPAKPQPQPQKKPVSVPAVPTSTQPQAPQKPQ